MARHGRGARVLPQAVWPGWALAGDAGYKRDPITAQGISDAFIDAAALTEALSTWLSGNGTFDELMETHETVRNQRVRPMYEFTTRLATLEPPTPEMQALFNALRHSDYRRHSVA